MLSNVLSNFKRPSDPAVASALARLVEWVRANGWADHLEPSRLSLELSDVRPRDLEAALQYLLSRGLLQVRYRAISPVTRQLMVGDYESPTAVDPILEDAFHNRFLRDEAEIVQVFVEPTK